MNFILDKEIEKKIIEATKKEIKYLANNEHARDFNLYSNPLAIGFYFMIFKIETLHTIEDYKTRNVILCFQKEGIMFSTPAKVHENKIFYNAMQLIKNYTRLEV